MLHVPVAVDLDLQRSLCAFPAIVKGWLAVRRCLLQLPLAVLVQEDISCSHLQKIVCTRPVYFQPCVAECKAATPRQTIIVAKCNH